MITNINYRNRIVAFSTIIFARKVNGMSSIKRIISKVFKVNPIYFVLLLPLAILLTFIASKYPSLVERYYTTTIYLYVSQIVSSITGVIPFSVAELILIIGTITIGWGIALHVKTVIYNRQNWIPMIKSHLLVVTVFTTVVYFLFVVSWGLNYHRVPLASIIDLEIEKSSVEELEALSKYLVEQANELREYVEVNNEGLMFVSSGIRDIFKRADIGFYEAAKQYPEFAGNYGRPKPVLFSRFLSYQKIGGFYFPFTGEANVNIDGPHFTIPFVALHEMAHQRGFAREDEANFIAYVTAMMHPDYDYQYSGTMLALNYVMNALRRQDIDRYQAILESYSPGVKRDFDDWRQQSQRFDGFISKVSNRVNNVYLQANAQSDGVQSYGRMVDLLLANYRTEIANRMED